jgi:hypothetical protein
MSSQKYDDRTTFGVLYPTDAVSRYVNVDSRFRTNPTTTASTDFYIRLPKTYKNIVSIRLASIELPNMWYEFSYERSNVSFYVTIGSTTNVITIPEGNYLTFAALLSATSKALAAAFPTITWSFGIPADSTTFQATLSAVDKSNNPVVFSMDFSKPVPGENPAVSTRPFDNDIGYFLGFTKGTYSGSSSYTGETVPFIVGPNYIFMELENYEGIESVSFSESSRSDFAKIIIAGEKGLLIVDNGSNQISKTVKFSQPQNISGFRVRLKDAYGLILKMASNFSFTLELVEALNVNLYNSYRQRIPVFP